jgi:glycosyltransferase involved in cell wall biosynthesis
VDLSIVIPVFKEEASIPPLVDEVRGRLKGTPDYEVTGVDGGSSDATPDVSGTV